MTGLVDEGGPRDFGPIGYGECHIFFAVCHSKWCVVFLRNGLRSKY